MQTSIGLSRVNGTSAWPLGFSTWDAHNARERRLTKLASCVANCTVFLKSSVLYSYSAQPQGGATRQA